MSENIQYPLEIKARQFEYLKEMATKYSIDDESKALRCLINFACANPDKEDEIFQEIRCLDC